MEENKKKLFALPGIFERFDVYNHFIVLWKNARYIFKDDVEIDNIYGTPYGAIFNGGRGWRDMIKGPLYIINYCKQFDIPINYVFTNTLIEKKHLSDTFCNKLLEWGNYAGNSITINSPLLLKYVKKNYVNYTFKSSTTKCITNTEEAIEELSNKDFTLMVPDYNYNNDFTFIDNVPKELRGKIEMLLNPVCMPHCPRRKEHYHQLALGNMWEDFNLMDDCPYQKKNFYETIKSPLFISNETIDKYMEKGINHFKIEGRTFDYDVLIEVLGYYLVKPEYGIEFRERMYYHK